MASLGSFLKDFSEKSPGVESLGLNAYPLEEADFLVLAAFLKQHPHIKTLNLRGTHLNDKCILLLTEIDTLDNLDVSENDLTAVGAEVLAKMPLKSLVISNNPIGDRGIQFLAVNKNLLTLEAVACKITPTGALALFQNDTLQRLDLSENDIGDFGLSNIDLNHTLGELTLGYANITPNGAIYLSKNNSITRLDLSSNALGNTGTQPLIGMKKLRSLDLSNNDIGDEGAVVFKETPLSPLAELTLYGNRITSTAATEILQNTSLTILNLSSNRLDDSFVQALVRTTKLLEFYASNNKLTTESMKVMGQLQNTALTRVDFSNTLIKQGLFVRPPKRQPETDDESPNKRPRPTASY